MREISRKLTARSMEMRASWGFIVGLYWTSQISLTGRFSQIRVSINPRHIFRWSSIFSQDQARTSSSRGIILRQSIYLIKHVILAFFLYRRDRRYVSEYPCQL